MNLIDCWLEDDIDKIYHLYNEKFYLNSIGIRGNKLKLQARAKEYLLDEA